MIPDAHQDMDDMGEFAMKHSFRPVNPYIPQGCDYQGRIIDGVHVQAAEASTEVGIEEDQSESADVYLWWIVGAVALLSCLIYTL